MTGASEVLVIGAGAAGLMCAIEASRRGRRVLVIDHADRPAEKIRISGGGRCNFTNLRASPRQFLSENPDFCVSALSRFSQHDFIARIEARGIAYHEKTLGQLFCDGSASAIIEMLLEDLGAAGGQLQLNVEPGGIRRHPGGFEVETSRGALSCEALVIATGGKSIPKMGASGYAYEVAERFGLSVVEPRPALVPFTLAAEKLEPVKELAGVSLPARVSVKETCFEEGMLFTHRGLSGPAILQISSYWREGEDIVIDLTCGADAVSALKQARRERPRLQLENALQQLIPKRLADQVAAHTYPRARLADLSDLKLREVSARLSAWRLRPDGTEGWRTAEVTLGGVSTDALSSRTMEARDVKGLYFVGECVDVTGWLGGYNFQWAWSSGWAAGQAA